MNSDELPVALVVCSVIAVTLFEIGRAICYYYPIMGDGNSLGIVLVIAGAVVVISDANSP